MANIKDNYDNNNPNGIINQQKASLGRRYVSDYNTTINSSDLEYEKTISGILEAKKLLDKRNKELGNAEKALAQAQKEGNKKREEAIQEYIKQLTNSTNQLNKNIIKDQAKLEENLGISIDIIKERAKREEEINEKLAMLAEQRAQIKSKEKLSEEDYRKLNSISEAEIKNRNELHAMKGEEQEEYFNNSIKAVMDSLGNKSSLGNALGLLSKTSNFGLGEKIDTGINKLSAKVGGIDKLVTITNAIYGALGAIRQQMTASIEDAARNLSNYYGIINANLESSGKTFATISDQADDILSVNRFVKQTDYLSKIAELSNQGITSDIETRAILETIKNKTLTQFNSMDGNLLRLVRLQTKANTASQFGMELQLKRVLNSVFKDSNYLSSMFDQVTGAIMDAGISTTSDITQFNSTVQTWLGAMYESGMGSDIVSQIAKGINSLGSGNVSALAQDETTQRLFLLAMDRAKMDYADVLQQGLSVSDTNKLLESVIKYLDEISKNTKDNLVLRSSYSNLFNMSVSDMKAVQKMSSKMEAISSKIVNTDSALQQTKNALSINVKANTTAAEQFDNTFANLSYTFGSSIAESKGLYTTYRTAEYLYNILNSVSQVGGKLGKVIGATKIVPAAAMYAIGGIGMIDLLKQGFSSFGDESLTGFLSSSEGYTGSSAASADSTSTIKKLTRTSMLGSGGLISSITGDSSEWEEEETSTLEILDEMSKTLMKLKNSENEYAFAVSVEGMNDEVLRSFASIFADEEAMMDTFEGDNKVLEKALFDYLDDTTSNSSNKKS